MGSGYGQVQGPQTPYPPYSQGGPSGSPSYGQPGAPSMPLYGQGYGQGPQPGLPLGTQSGWGGPPAPFEQPKKNTGLIVGLVVALLLVLVAGGTAAFVLSRGGASTPSGQVTPQPTATATTPATPALAVIYQNSLKGSPANWLKGSGCSPQADGIHVTADISCLAPTQDLTDFTLTVTAKEISGDASKLYGVTFRVSNKVGTSTVGNTYIFLMSNDGNWIFAKEINGAPTPLGQATSTAIHIGANIIGVVAKGTQLSVSVNGTQLTSVSDSAIAKGKCGLQGITGGHVVFTDLTITHA